MNRNNCNSIVASICTTIRDNDRKGEVRTMVKSSDADVVRAMAEKQNDTETYEGSFSFKFAKRLYQFKEVGDGRLSAAVIS